MGSRRALRFFRSLRYGRWENQSGLGLLYSFRLAFIGQGCGKRGGHQSSGRLDPGFSKTPCLEPGALGDGYSDFRRDGFLARKDFAAAQGDSRHTPTPIVILPF